MVGSRDLGSRLRRLSRSLQLAAKECEAIAAAFEGARAEEPDKVRAVSHGMMEGALLKQLSAMSSEELDTTLPRLRVSELEDVGNGLGVAFRKGKTPKAELVRLVKASLRWDARMGVVGRPAGGAPSSDVG